MIMNSHFIQNVLLEHADLISYKSFLTFFDDFK